MFLLLQEILGRQRNNPVKTFERSADIESWLREQWAGLFREFLHRRSEQQQLAALSGQVTVLQGVTTTLRRYLEVIVSKVAEDQSKNLIDSEHERLDWLSKTEALKDNEFVSYVAMRHRVDMMDIAEALRKARSAEEFAAEVGAHSRERDVARRIVNLLSDNDAAQHDFNEARKLIGAAPIEFPPRESN